MVLVISAAKASVIQIHTMDHLSSCSGAGKAWTVAAITPAAAGVGIPMKYFEPPGAMPCTLKRSEERRVGKECRSRWWTDQSEKKQYVRVIASDSKSDSS